MAEIDWVPSLVVLAVGLIAGVVMARLQGSSGKSGAGRAADLEDLRRQKERLVRALRDLQDLPRGEVATERADLELQTADVMRRLDAAEVADRQAATKAAVHKASKEAATVGLSPEIKGMLKGAAVVAFVALCFFILTRSTGERADGMGMTGGQPGVSATQSGDPDAAPDLGPRGSARLEAARAGVAASPQSIDAQIELGFALIEAEGWMEAFSLAEGILEQAPASPDGLAILGVVRLKMGQPDVAADLFGQALQGDPDHLAALSYAGLVALQSGDREAARTAWTRARARAEGPDAATLDELLVLLESDVPIPGLEPDAGHPR